MIPFHKANKLIVTKLIKQRSVFVFQARKKNERKMKFICAGYPKTGSKSCSAALRQLGYTVCDYVETMEYIAPTWADYVDGHV